MVGATNKKTKKNYINKPEVKFIKVQENAQLPIYAHEGDSGMDLRTAEAFSLAPGERKTITTGLRIKIEDGYEGQVRPRSGLAAKDGITVVNAPGTIDQNYTGECKVILLNTDKEFTFHAKVGDRIAQLVICPVQQAKIVEVNEFTDTTNRGTDGFGSSGVK
jgi:dUTP pyrophosphatase